MAKTRDALGRGLSALIPDTEPEHLEEQPSEVDLDLLVPNRSQPRSVFDEEKLEELSRSISGTGLIQPIVVRALDGDRFEIIAGERRWRAAQMAGLLRVPVILRDVPDEKLLEVALIENLQRENLNPIEEGEAYRRLIDEHQMTQDAVAVVVGRDRTTVANYIRLLALPREVQGEVVAGALSMGHARALLGLTEALEQKRVAQQVLDRGLSVRDTEELVKRLGRSTEAQTKPSRVELDVHTKEAQDRLKVALGTRVRIVRQGKKGRLEILFNSENELQRLFELLTTK
ncbi:MAG: chromosome partitioning protein ParB [Acidobacteria bacterium]|nr:chromosome partitioning protein ParB [Acidobacteriota bacterium]|tara:strand:- start:64 stop:924 length:861 start_codon:yes stop_codon:yes gene_type:complete